jgi:hypothetical protein
MYVFSLFSAGIFTLSILPVMLALRNGKVLQLLPSSSALFSLPPVSSKHTEHISHGESDGI